MTTNDLLKRLQNLPASDPAVPASPPLELVALIVRWSRGMRQWKVSTLADFARVSTSTVERVDVWSTSSGRRSPCSSTCRPSDRRLLADP